jgi:chorismate synthase
LTNNAGGILGGLSTGMPLVLRVAFKPASSIAIKQRTVDLQTKKPADLIVEEDMIPALCLVHPRWLTLWYLLYWQTME